MASSEALKSVTTSALSAGLMSGFGAHFGIPTTATECTKPIHHVQRYALQAGIDMGLNMAMGADFKEAAVKAGRFAAAGTMGGIASNHIGAAGFDFMTHKILHAAAGALGGLIASGDALSGATGAVSAEILAEMIQENPKITTKRVVDKVKAEGKPVSAKRLESLIQAELKKTMDISRLGAAVTTLLAKQDVSVGIATATTAVENNFIPSLGAKLTKAVVEELGLLALNIMAGLLAKKQIEEVLQDNTMDAAPDDVKWTDQGVSTEEAKPKVLGTPAADPLPQNPGYEAGPYDLLQGWLEGFSAYDGPDIGVLTKDGDKPFGTYEDIGYHHRQSKGVKSAAPANGQTVLDKSIGFLPTTKARIGVDQTSKEFVVLYPSNPEATSYHGHVRKWEDLTQAMQSALIKEDLVTKKGKIKK